MATSKDYFEANPKVDQFHTTEDGGHFVSKNDAILHGSALKKAGKGVGKVTPITRAQAMAETSEESAPTEDSKKPNTGLLKAAITRAQTALDKAKDGKDEAAIASATERLAAAQKAYNDAGGQ